MAKRQNGIAMLMIVIVLALTISVYYFSTVSVVGIKTDNIKSTRLALSTAKNALINYAITHVDGNGGGIAGEFGYLPCPDSNGAFGVEGNQDTGGVCGGRYKNKLGYLPWKTLDLPVLKDGSGSCLWYAVSGSYKGENPSGLINDDTEGLFQIVDEAGVVLKDNIVAVVFAPGASLANQNRVIDSTTHCGEDYGNESAYLEGDGVTDNAIIPDIVDSADQFIHATLTSDESENIADIPYNDYLITISKEEIWKAIKLRDDLKDGLEEVTEALAQCMSEYVNHADNPNKRLPWPARLDIAGGDYRIMDNYSDELNAISGYAGRFPFNVVNSNAVIVTAIDNNYLEDATPNICSNMNLPITGVANVNLTVMTDEHRVILENWKDHFFFFVSKDYALPDVAHTGCGGDCVSVGVVNYSAIVFFSGSPYREAPELQSRNIADKPDVSNYLENGNDVLFPDTDGNGAYATTDPDPTISNDIMFCLTDNAVPTVVAC